MFHHKGWAELALRIDESLHQSKVYMFKIMDPFGFVKKTKRKQPILGFSYLKKHPSHKIHHFKYEKKDDE